MLFFSCSTISEDISSEYYNIGNAYYDVGNFEKAIEYYKKAMEEDHLSKNKIRYNLAIAYSESNMIEEGVKHFEILLEQDPENLLVLQALAYAYYLNEDEQNALRIYDEILSIFEFDSTALFNKALILIENTETEKARSLLEKLAVVDSSIEVIHLLGGIYKDAGDWELYRQLFESVLISNQVDQEIVAGLIEYYEKEKLYYKVIEYIDIMLELPEVENSSELLFRKGSIMILELNDYNNGVKNLKDAVESGFDDLDSIKLLLESDDFYQEDDLIDYFKSKNLFK